MWKSLVAIGLAGLVASVLASTLKPSAADERPEDVQAIQAHIDSIFRAYMAGDRETIRATHSEDWRGFLTRSTSILRGIDEYMATADVSLARPSRMVGYEMLEIDVHFRGDLALVPYVAALDIETDGARIDFRPKLRVLDVYAREDGEWIQIASNTSRHPDTEKALREFGPPPGE